MTKIKDTQHLTEELNDNKKIVISFLATWCTPCNNTKPILKELSQERQDIKFLTVDIDENQNIANDYAIFSVPTIIVVKDKQQINSRIGYGLEDNKKTFNDFINEK